MCGFIIINQEQLQENYLEIESERNEEPSTRWYNFYIFTHFLKAPLLCPYIILLIIGNGGKIIK
jgi:hypothetical protein|tara:strand:+ start:1260 stop:1451 length:192 start_codon:yes stop_codon:yes gene_type:complete